MENPLFTGGVAPHATELVFPIFEPAKLRFEGRQAAQLLCLGSPMCRCSVWLRLYLHALLGANGEYMFKPLLGDGPVRY